MIKTYTIIAGVNGTGKTTFLRKLKQESPKRMVVVAPTGIAAINAGGVTIHSFFQIPFAPYVPAIAWLKVSASRKKPLFQVRLPHIRRRKHLMPGTRFACIMWGWILRKNLLHELQIGYGKAGTTFRRQMYVVVLKVE